MTNQINQTKQTVSNDEFVSIFKNKILMSIGQLHPMFPPGLRKKAESRKKSECAQEMLNLYEVAENSIEEKLMHYYIAKYEFDYKE